MTDDPAGPAPAGWRAVVIAAGEGRRLRPFTERYAKGVLPIDGRPVLGTLMRELAAAGCARVVVVTGHLAEQVEALVGDGRAFGLAVRYARQAERLGSADAVLRAAAEPPFLVVAADTVFTPGDIRRCAQAFAASGAAGAMSARRDPPPGPGKAALRVAAGRVERVLDDDPANPVGSAPLWAIGPRLAPFLEGLPGPPYELVVAFQRAVDAGELVIGVEIGPTRDLTHPLDVIEHNFAYLAATAPP